MMNAAVDAIDHGIGFATQLVMKTPINQPPDDRGIRPAGLDDIVAERPLPAAPCERLVHGLDDVAAHAEIAQDRFGVRSECPLRGSGGRRKTAPFQVLQAADHQATDVRVVRAGLLRPKVDESRLVGAPSDLAVD